MNKHIFKKGVRKRALACISVRFVRWFFFDNWICLYIGGLRRQASCQVCGGYQDRIHTYWLCPKTAQCHPTIGRISSIPRTHPLWTLGGLLVYHIENIDANRKNDIRSFHLKFRIPLPHFNLIDTTPVFFGFARPLVITWHCLFAQ